MQVQLLQLSCYVSLLTSLTFVLLAVVGGDVGGPGDGLCGISALALRIVADTMPRLWTAPAVWWQMAVLSKSGTGHGLLLVVLSFATNLAGAVAGTSGHAWHAQMVWSALRCAPVPILSTQAWRMVTSICASAPASPFAMLVHARLAALIGLQLPALAHLAALDGVLSAAQVGTARCVADVMLLFVLPAIMLEINRSCREETGSPVAVPHGLTTSARIIKQYMLANERKSQVLLIMSKELRAPLTALVTAPAQFAEPAPPGDAPHAADVTPLMKVLAKHLLLVMDCCVTADALSTGQRSMRCVCLAFEQLRTTLLRIPNRSPLPGPRA